MTTLHLRKSIAHSPLSRRSFSEGGSLITDHHPATPKPSEGGSLLTVLLLVLACFGLSAAPKAFSVTPAPDGGYPNNTTAEGTNALFSLTTGLNNTAVGFDTLFHDTTGGYNTAIGEQTLYTNVTGIYNTATGYRALYNNTASYNTADGFKALFSNTTGGSNTANGNNALFSNTTGGSNTANGYNVLYSNTTGGSNTANGIFALFNNSTGSQNTADGVFALFNNTTGSGNVAIGYQALEFNTASGFPPDDGTCVAIGYQALQNNTVWDNNAVGFQALQSNTTGLYNNAFGWHALINNTTGSSNTAIGDDAGASATTGSGNVYIGAGMTGAAGESATTYIRNVYATVQPVVGTDPDYVTVNSSGRLGRGNISSRRYKHDIKPMDKASEAIFVLQPVTFRYNQEFDHTQTLAFGLIAEEVEKVNPDLVGRNSEGQPESVRYEQINAMLLNEFLKEHRKVEKLTKDFQATVAQQQNEIQALTAQLKEQAAQIQKVSARLELNKPAPRTVVNNQ